MPINCDDLNEYAKALAIDGANETQVRSAVSRSYYAAFHSVLPLAELLPVSSAAPQGLTTVTHTELTNRLKEWRVSGVHPELARMTTTAAQLKSVMATARAARVKADYKLGATVSLGEAKAQIERARLVKRVMVQIAAQLAKSSAATGTA